VGGDEVEDFELVAGDEDRGAVLVSESVDEGTEGLEAAGVEAVHGLV
jgi:hypothetical protein